MEWECALGQLENRLPFRPVAGPGRIARQTETIGQIAPIISAHSQPMSAAEIGRISVDLQDAQRAAVHALTLPPGNRSDALTRRTDKPQGDDEEKTMRKLTVMMVLAVVLAACAGGRQRGSIDGLLRVGGGETRGPVVDQQLEEIDLAPEPGSLDVVFDIPDDRKVIRRARLQIEAADTRKVFDEILETTELAGGFVSSATVFLSRARMSNPR